MITATASTTVSNLPAFDRHINRAATIPIILARYAEMIVQTAQQYAPVDTDALRQTIHFVLMGAVAMITAGEGLPDGRAVFQEFGFHHHGSGAFIQNAYLRPAVEQHINNFFAEIAAALA